MKSALRNRFNGGSLRSGEKPGTRLLGVSRWRYGLLVAGLVTLPFMAVWQVAKLQVMPDVDRGFRFLQNQGDARTVRTEAIPAYRGVITDRRGEPLAISTPVVSLWANPQVLQLNDDNLAPLARQLDVQPQLLSRRIAAYADKEFVYLSRQLTPDEAEAVLDLGIDGIYKQVEYKRYYPAAEVTAQLLGFTNIDDAGQEGMELAFNRSLSGRPGAKQVLKDRRGRVIKELQLLRSEIPGKNLALSIDLRLQYLAYRELKSAISRFSAASGSVVILDVSTGEVLAMVNQPSYNPNDRGRLDTAAMRNRAITDLIEPGSVMKPLTMVAALESGKFTPHTIINTSPGSVRIGSKTFVDPVNYGPLDIAGILTKSSQVGTTKVAMELEPEDIRGVFERVGLGQSPGTGFPGESPGMLPSKTRWRAVERATMAFGYGMTVTPLQVAMAYSVLASGGIKKPVSLLKLEDQGDNGHAVGERVIDELIAADVREMLMAVTKKGGTGTRAAIPGYQVSGKTGTSHKVGAGGYQKDRYISLFAGMVPADAPRLVTVVVINDPRSEQYFGGLVAAPVFATVTTDALRLLNIPPMLEVDESHQVVEVPKRRPDASNRNNVLVKKPTVVRGGAT